MNFVYYQNEGGEEVWQAAPVANLEKLKTAMFVTVLAVDTPVRKEMSKQELDGLKYKGPLYFDLDDSESPASTAMQAAELLGKLGENGANLDHLMLYASGGKGFHVIVPEGLFLTKPNKAGTLHLPAIYKEMAYKVAVDSMDFRVYTARRGRMFRQANVQRPNGLYKVRITPDELYELSDLAKADPAAAETKYKEICSTVREDVAMGKCDLASGLAAMYDECRSKVAEGAKKAKKAKPVTLPKELPSFEALLNGEGIRDDAGFHNLAMQIAIISHAKGLKWEDLEPLAQGLIEKHEGDGSRYNTDTKRREELRRMYEYMDDNPCYAYSAGAIVTLLSHAAPDLRGIEASAEEVREGIENPIEAEEADEYGHAGVTMTSRGAFAQTENGMKQISALAFDNVTELMSMSDNQVAVVEADVLVGGKKAGTQVLSLETFNSVSNYNKFTMRYGQSFAGNDVQARGMFMRVVEKARKSKKRMYAVAREGLDILNIPFSEHALLREHFLLWSDGAGVKAQPRIAELETAFRFVGYPDPEGTFKTDLSTAPDLSEWVRDPENKALLHDTMTNLFKCQHPSHVGKWLGWFTACHWRMLFHVAYMKFPLLHVNGAAGSGKTETTNLFSNLHYYHQEAKMLTPTSTLFAVQQAIAGSASIPLILDEFKPAEMTPGMYDRFKLVLRDAYNCRTVERGGGNQGSADYRSIHSTSLSAPVVFIAESAESETAVMERVVLLTLTRGGPLQNQKYRNAFEASKANRHVLGIIGQYLAGTIIEEGSIAALRAEFDPIYAQARLDLMLQEGDLKNLSADQYQAKAAAKERTVFNYAVARFGLVKFQQLMTMVFENEFDEEFKEFNANLYNTMEELRQQTIPEWLKVFNRFADLAEIDSADGIRKKREYLYCQVNGKECIAFYLRACYHRYRTHCSRSGEKPLFASEASFLHSAEGLQALEGANRQVEGLEVPGGSHVFDLQALRNAGFIAPKA